jgi:sugar lactone lactonase YvrE
MLSFTAERRVRDGLIFPENPRWREGMLYFSDIFDGTIWAIAENGAGGQIAKLEAGPSGLGFLPDGDLLAVSMQESRLLRWRNQAFRLHADLAHLAPYGLNDMAVDRAGRAYVVQLASDSMDPAPMLIVEPDGSARLHDEPLHVGNGICLTSDGRRLIVAESAGCQLSLFDVAANGTVSARRILSLPDGHYPDGICLDEEGGIWAACLWHGVIRITEDGSVTHRVSLPGKLNAYACMLGGSDRCTLFICAAQSHLRDSACDSRSGAILAMEMDCEGAGVD